ncbi:class I SAM-dependent methyltransferase [Patescibacteria group bacterium]|nr:class I SAM-dependent methyltransferase [Patescibacteria group bacterium]
MDNINYPQRILEDLVEFTGKPKPLVAERCKTASVELAWDWDKRKDTLQYYRDTDLYIFDLTFYQSMLAQDLNFMLESAKEKGVKKILDFGGGIGEYTIRAIKELGAEVTYLEIAGSKTLEYAKWRFKKYGVEPKIVDENYPWQKEKWDAIFAMDVLEHLENPEPTIKAFEETTKYVFANPAAIQFNWLYPQHISKFVLANFTEIGLNLYQNTKAA